MRDTLIFVGGAMCGCLAAFHVLCQPAEIRSGDNKNKGKENDKEDDSDA